MECEVELEEWGCASEIKQILNKIKAAPCKPAEVLSVWDEKAMCWDWLGFSEENGDFQKGVGRVFGEKRV